MLISFAQVAKSNRYVRPAIVPPSSALVIKEGRHPVVEVISKERFVANDTLLDEGENRTMIITGPNMAGKSTYMRQTALIVLMAHIGSFVPAKSAEIPVTDRIFTRVGASDNLIFDQSTFMVEMIEVAAILQNATKNSLLILDEVGRGTSTYDGLSIAWAVIENLTQKIGAKTMFATHYHELTELESRMEGVKNYKIAVKEINGSVVFLRKIMRGGANRSFGIEVAALAGVPREVTDRAKQILKAVERKEGATVSYAEGEEEEKQPSEVIVKLDSNMAFGTGEHETTSMCLELLQQALTPESVCLDVGCGSGILGISAVLLGAKSAYLTDIDPVATDSATHNCKLNGVAEKCTVKRTDLIGENHIVADIALANITADVLCRLAPTLPPHIKDGGTLILSGIIKEKLDGVLETYGALGFEHKRTVNKGEWYAAEFIKRAA